MLEPKVLSHGALPLLESLVVLFMGAMAPLCFALSSLASVFILLEAKLVFLRTVASASGRTPLAI